MPDKKHAPQKQFGEGRYHGFESEAPVAGDGACPHSVRASASSTRCSLCAGADATTTETRERPSMTGLARSSRRTNSGTTDIPWRRWCNYGKLDNASGSAADYFLAGWLPHGAACAAMGLTSRQLERAVTAGAIRKQWVGPGAALYEIFTEETNE